MAAKAKQSIANKRAYHILSLALAHWRDLTPAQQKQHGGEMPYMTFSEYEEMAHEVVRLARDIKRKEDGWDASSGAFIPANDAERLFGVPAGYGDTSERDHSHAPDCTCAGCRGDEPHVPECPPPPSFGKCDLCKKETSDLKQCRKCGAWCCYMDWMRQDDGTTLCDHCDFEQAYGEAWQ